MQGQQYREVLHNFRVNIRRKQINHLYETTRKSIQMQHKNQQSRLAIQNLANASERDKWLNDIALALSGQPNHSWHSIFRQLLPAVRIFQAKHAQWCNVGIVKSLTDIFKSEYCHLGLSKLAADILTDIIYFNQFTDPKVIKIILSYLFVNDLVTLCHSSFQNEYLRLLAVLAKTVPKIRDQLYTQGCFTLAVQMITNSSSKNTEEVTCCLYFIQVMISSFQVDKDTIVQPKKQIVRKTIIMISNQIHLPYTNSNLCLLLKICSQFCSLEKQCVYNQIFASPTLIPKILDILSYESNSQICRLSCIVVSKLLLSKNSQHTEMLLVAGILDRIEEGLIIHGKNNEQFYYTVLSLLSNLSADSSSAKEKLLKHRVFDDFVISASYSNSNKIRKQAIYVLCNYLYDLDKQQLEWILMNSKIMDALVDNLAIEGKFNQNFEEILKGLTQLLKQFGSQIIFTLGSYHLEQIVERIDEEYLEEQISQFLDLLAQAKNDLIF